MEIFYLITGFIILLLVGYDFFFTTLSGSGAGMISNVVSTYSDKAVKQVVKITGRSGYLFNGLFVNLMMLLVWILLVWAGLFLVYSYNPEAITNSNGEGANVYERLYFTGYVISTLGIGNFKPTSGFFEIITSCFAFFGFIFFTSSMTYFISVSSALVNKRLLAKTVNSLGKSPTSIAKKFVSMNSSYTYQQFLNLQELVDTHAVNHHAYPVVHYYTEKDPNNCLSLNMARLDEALSILIGSREEAGNLQEEIEPLRSSITDLLQKLDNKFSANMPAVNQPVDSSKFSYKWSGLKGEEREDRRKILEEWFRSEGFRWGDVVEDMV